MCKACFTLNLMKNCLRDLRVSMNINQTQLAENCGVSRQTIHAIEIDKYTPSVDLALKLAKVLKTSVEKIFLMENK